MGFYRRVDELRELLEEESWTLTELLPFGSYRCNMTEYELLMKALLPLLEEVSVAELDRECVSFLAGESKLGSAHKELVSMFLRDVQEISKDVFVGLEKNGGTPSNQLEAILRVEQVTPRYDELQPLLAAGISSAKEIADMPDEVFVETFKTPGMSKTNDDTESRLLLLFKRWLNWRTHHSAP